MTTSCRNHTHMSRATGERHAPDEQQFQQLYQENQRLISGYVHWVLPSDRVDNLFSLFERFSGWFRIIGQSREACSP